MIRFVDLNNGSVYNGSVPYIHWFDDDQSVNLNYVKKLCIACEYEEIAVNLPENDIFTLLDMSKLSSGEDYDININEFTYKNINIFKTNTITSTGVLYNLDDQHVYLHMVYVLAKSNQEGEFLEDLYINDDKFTIGSSFYEKYEPHKINLSNLGVEIPESIIRAVYPSNVHEEDIDNVLLNRKYKELLNEYWNIIANKGSYKSLYNALSWFEYGDLVKIQELRKNPDNYIQQDITPYINEKISAYLENNKKTTYMGLYLPLQQLLRNEDNKVVYSGIIEDINLNYFNSEDGMFSNAVLSQPIAEGDSKDQIFTIGDDSVSVTKEGNEEDFNSFNHSDWIRITASNYKGFIREENPELMHACSKWSNEDLSLKMYLLGNFFETYFMPIHLDLIHSTIETIVFTNTIKIIQDCTKSRIDSTNNFFTFKCNVHDNDVFFLDNVNTQTGPDTPMGVQWRDGIEYGNVPILGVEKSVSTIKDDQELKTFMTQYYNGIGCVVDFVCDVNIDKNDFIKGTRIILKGNKDRDITEMFKTLKNQEESKDIRFSILCKNEGDYKITIEFVTANGYNYIKTISFSILDTSSKDIKIYKVKYNTLEEHEDTTKYPEVGNYVFSQYDNNEGGLSWNKFFLPTNNPDGVYLNRTIIMEGDVDAGEIISDNNTMLNTHTIKKHKIEENKINDEVSYTITDEVSYTIFIIPKDGVVDDNNIDKSLLVRDDYVFYPQKHHLEEIGVGNNLTLDDYTFKQNDVLMVVPETKYLKYIKEPEWEFINVSKRDSTPITFHSIRTPFVANSEYKLLERGFYDIKFRYKLGQTIQETILDSAFRII